MKNSFTAEDLASIPDYCELLDVSENFRIYNAFEEVYLYSKKNKTDVCTIGDFYGDPTGGFIDPKERFCITFGYGFIVYFLDDPFEDYEYDTSPSQWVEKARDSEEEAIWFEKIIPQGEFSFMLLDKFGAEYSLSVDVEHKTISFSPLSKSQNS